MALDQVVTQLMLLLILKQCFDDLDSGKRVRSRFFDLTKAFDTVSHSILANKLEIYSFNTLSVNLIESYLTNRFQAVSLKDKISDFRKVNHGLPQWSIVGLLLDPYCLLFI